MLTPGLLAVGALGLATASLYAALGRLELRRSMGRRHGASVAMALFWIGLGVYVAVDSAWGLAAALGSVAPAASAFVLHLKIVSGALAFAGLVYHLVYLYSGRAILLAPILFYYSIVLALIESSYLARVPIGHELTAWAARHAFVHEAGAMEDIALALLFLPPLVSTIAYALLARLAPDPARRRRIAYRTLALSGFFAGLLVGFLADWSWWEPVERALAMTTGLVAYLGTSAKAEDAHAAPT